MVTPLNHMVVRTALIVTLCALYPTATDSVNDNYKLGDDGYYYKLHSQQVKYSEAVTRCAAEGAQLAVADNSISLNYIKNSFHEHPQGIWVGLRVDPSSGYKWMWLNGMPMQTSYWFPGEPNNFMGVQEDCAILNYGGSSGGRGLYDAPCSWTEPKFLCQKDINKCLSGNNACHEKATCNNTDGSYTCTCNSGYHGNGKNCTDINECLNGNSPCHEKATCKNTDGSYTCTCNRGYYGNGTNCTDIDECKTNNGGCDSNAVCTNTVGSRACKCNKGFKGNGETCNDVDECKTYNGNCDSNAICTNTVGSRTCQCKKGFQGDGITCFEPVRKKPKVIKSTRTGVSDGTGFRLDCDVIEEQTSTDLQTCFRCCLDNKNCRSFSFSYKRNVCILSRKVKEDPTCKKVYEDGFMYFKVVA